MDKRQFSAWLSKLSLADLQNLYTELSALSTEEGVARLANKGAEISSADLGDLMRLAKTTDLAKWTRALGQQACDCGSCPNADTPPEGPCG